MTALLGVILCAVVLLAILAAARATQAVRETQQTRASVERLLDAVQVFVGPVDLAEPGSLDWTLGEADTLPVDQEGLADVLRLPPPGRSIR